MARPLATNSGWVRTERDGDGMVVTAGGRWDVATLAEIDTQLRTLTPDGARSARIDLAAMDHMDTAGAWVLCRTKSALETSGIAVDFAGVKPAHAALLDRVARSHVEHIVAPRSVNPFVAWLERAGRAATDAGREGIDLVSFLGVTSLTAAHSVMRPTRIRVTALAVHIERVGLDAMPIVGLLAFLIGVVVAYQGADQLSRFGAAIFTVNLLGVSILREMGVLLTAIILAGRSGSAFTAQIGTMQVNQEIDAMRTIGLDPMEQLVLPRVWGLTIAMPLLAIYADIMGLLGGALMSFVVLDISAIQFMERLKSAVPMSSFWVGLIKAPVFGFVIAMVGCREGLKVSGSAESVGIQTTKSVAVSIFLVIVIDALFSIFFSYIGV